MKHLLLPSIIAMLTVPAFADTVTTLPNNALCNETNLGTESGSADIEVVWEANTINTQWYTGYGENTAAASATTCEYGGTINLPATNPSRPGYAFAGWKLRTPTVPSNPLANLDTSINGTNSGYISNDGLKVSNSNDYNLTENGSWAVEFSYGTVYGQARCQAKDPGHAYIDENSDNALNGQIDVFLSEYATIAGPEKATILSQGITDYVAGNITLEELATLVDMKLYTTSGNVINTGNYCYCRIIGYKPDGATTIQNISSSQWGYLRVNFEDHCEDGCAGACGEYFLDNEFYFRQKLLDLTE